MSLANQITLQIFIKGFCEYLDNLDYENPILRLAKYLGIGKFNLVSSSLIISQLPFLIVNEVQSKLRKFGKNDLYGDPSLERLQKSLLQMTYKMIANHFHLISILLCDNGVLHFASTYKITYHREIGFSQKSSPIDLYDMGLVAKIIGLGFESISAKPHVWFWDRRSTVGEVFNCLGLTFRGKSIEVRKSNGFFYKELN